MTGSLAPESADHIQHKREDHAQQNGGYEREIERCVLSAIEDVAWEAANGQVRAAEQD